MIWLIIKTLVKMAEALLRTDRRGYIVVFAILSCPPFAVMAIGCHSMKMQAPIQPTPAIVPIQDHEPEWMSEDNPFWAGLDINQPDAALKAISE